MATEEPGPADYALMQSLFVDSDTYYPGKLEYISRLLQQSTRISSIFDLADPTDSHTLVIPDPAFPSEGDIHTAAADEIIEAAMGAYDQEEAFKLALESSYSDVRFLQAAHKLELPSLRSDPRQDLKALARVIGEAKLDGFFCKPSTLPLEPVDDRKDEGLEMPASAVHFHTQLTQGVEPDELDICEEDLLYVAESLYTQWADEDLENLVNHEVGCTTASILSCWVSTISTLTPPPATHPDHDSAFNRTLA
ncbi:hypothetical protein LZ30DRAFT_649694 [Colletotrichum cereale]|nr:hypothetical protein LZ30DRAFT_649694 [Colletotrichum cereale]